MSLSVYVDDDDDGVGEDDDDDEEGEEARNVGKLRIDALTEWRRLYSFIHKIVISHAHKSNAGLVTQKKRGLFHSTYLLNYLLTCRRSLALINT